MDITVNELQNRLDAILHFLEPYWEFVNCHMVNFIVDNYWEKFVPIQLRNEVPSEVDGNDCITNIYWQNGNGEKAASFPSYLNFIRAVQNCALVNITSVLKSQDSVRKYLGCVNMDDRIVTTALMSPKKLHEVSNTAQLIGSVMELYKRNAPIFLVEAGNGKGYLSSYMSLKYGHDVLGIDLSGSNSLNAQQRYTKLQKIWKTHQKKNATENNFNSSQSTKVYSYKTLAMFMTADINISEILKMEFEEFTLNSPQYCLCGLHTCGNLASNCIKVFHKDENCKILCNIGCCYHLLDEIYEETEKINVNENNCGFPLSEYLKSRQVQLGRNARMLASQSFDRIIYKKELPSISLFYRAIFETILYLHNSNTNEVPTVRVGKVQNCQNFAEYYRKCKEKFNINIPNDIIDSLEQIYSAHRYRLNLFYLLRTTIAPLIEGLILLDRLLYLKELGYNKSFLVQLFEPKVSPRCISIFAIK